MAKRRAPAQAIAPKAKATAASLSRKRPRGVDSLLHAEPMDRPGVVKARRLGRRDSDEQVERIMAKKLYPTYAREIIEGAIAEDGMTPRQMITKEVRSTKFNGEYLKASFWTQFFAKFPLQKGLAALLPDPPLAVLP